MSALYIINIKKKSQFTLFTCSSISIWNITFDSIFFYTFCIFHKALFVFWDWRENVRAVRRAFVSTRDASFHLFFLVFFFLFFSVFLLFFSKIANAHYDDILAVEGETKAISIWWACRFISLFSLKYTKNENPFVFLCVLWFPCSFATVKIWCGHAARFSMLILNLRVAAIYCVYIENQQAY